jgi:NAD+ synthase (glutamine-hydrolysing)
MSEPSGKLCVALAQIDPTVGDIDGNVALIVQGIERARDQGADLVLFPEQCVAGYPAEDLYLKRHFAEASREAVERLAKEASGIAALVGFAEHAEGRRERRRDGPAPPPVHNSLALLTEGRIEAIHRKNLLPNYGVFDEVRYFVPGHSPTVVEIAGVKVGLTICEDVWEPGPPGSLEAEAGAALIVNASGSPYLVRKGADRERMFADRARDYGVPIAFCNLVGGQDDLVFDGHSFVVGPGGEIVARARQFEEDMLIWELGGDSARVEQPLSEVEEVYAALVLGVRDYVRKNGFERTIVGLSGGIDSALVALIAADAVGPQRLICAVMPSPHSSQGTQDDARAIARNLGAELLELPIEPAMDAYSAILGDAWSGAGLAAENIQARIRGNLLMALSNDRGGLVLATGNKSETSVGYSTLYGDMAGGLSPIKDVPKLLVYRLVEHRNSQSPGPIVPRGVLERPPSAELRPDQRDEDSLPPYDVLDRILQGYVERDLSQDELVAEGLEPEVVEHVIRMVDRAEYKRRQSAPGIRITSRAFGRDRRLPITNRFDG